MEDSHGMASFHMHFYFDGRGGGNKYLFTLKKTTSKNVKS